MKLEAAKTLLKRHYFWAIAPVLMLPLSVILVVQYRSLRTLEETLPVHRKEMMWQYLRAVTAEVTGLYSAQAEKLLAVPAGAIGFRQGGVIQDNAERMRALLAVERAADHFKQHQFTGAKRLFVAVETEYGGTQRSEVLFYHPTRQAMEFDPQAPELRAINVAFAPYRFYIRERAVLQSQAAGADRDPNVVLIIRPILDDERKAVGIAGLVADQEWFKNEVVPKAIQNALPRFFPADYREAIVTVRDAESKVVYATRRDGDLSPEVNQRFTSFFLRYSLGLRMRHLSVEQWTRRSFLLNLSLSLAMTLVLAAGMIMALRAAAREMKLSQMKTDFVANVSHELRTPLASIRVFSELLKLGRVKHPDRVREYGSYIETQGRRLTQIINNILDFSRIESGRKSYQRSPTDLREVVADALEACAGRLKQSGHIIDVEVADQPLPQVLVDPDALVLAVTNLLDNAIKYSGKAKEILLRLDRQNGFAIISVQDQGIGIAREEQGKIFEKFYRVSTGMVHDVKGTGLGLAIVKRIVEAHRGRVTVESEPGCGSTFTIHLPMEKALKPLPG